MGMKDKSRVVSAWAPAPQPLLQLRLPHRGPRVPDQSRGGSVPGAPGRAQKVGQQRGQGGAMPETTLEASLQKLEGKQSDLTAASQTPKMTGRACLLAFSLSFFFF